MPASLDTLRSDFDHLARLSSGVWDHNSHYHDYLLRHVSLSIGPGLDIGCGAGEFSRRLAGRCSQVVGLDLSPGMVRVAQERSAGNANLIFRVADALTCDLPASTYDVAASIATLHHLPLETMLRRMASALRPGGVLLVLDLFQGRSAADYAVGALGFPAGRLLSLLHTGRLSPPPEVRRAWEIHGRNDVYPSLAEVRQSCMGAIPGAQVRRHLLWRYSIVWRKPVEEGS